MVTVLSDSRSQVLKDGKLFEKLILVSLCFDSQCNEKLGCQNLPRPIGVKMSSETSELLYKCAVAKDQSYIKPLPCSRAIDNMFSSLPQFLSSEQVPRYSAQYFYRMAPSGPAFTLCEWGNIGPNQMKMTTLKFSRLNTADKSA